jgi:hypothetical protein
MELPLASLVNEALVRLSRLPAATAEVAGSRADARKELPVGADGNERFTI